MDELISRLISIRDLSELDNINEIDSNELIYAISKANKYELLNNSNLRLNVNNKESFERLIDFLLTDEDILYYMFRNGFDFTDDELDYTFNVVSIKYKDQYEFDLFFRYFFSNEERLNNFIKGNKDFFMKYISEKGNDVSYTLKKCDTIVEMIILNGNSNLISNLDSYSVSNLKLLSYNKYLIDSIKDYDGTDRLVNGIFEVKSELTPSEFCSLLCSLKDPDRYDRKMNGSDLSSFSIIVDDNIDYIIDMVSQSGIIPNCLKQNSLFVKECIKRNRIDIASKCAIPLEVLQDEKLSKAYCEELNIDPGEFKQRANWVINYSKKNNNVFNTLLATSLKDNIFNVNMEHFERFINDVNVQTLLSELSDKELQVFAKIINNYHYKDCDITFMISNIINNIPGYSELINNIDVNKLSNSQIEQLTRVLQLPNNPYNVNDIESLTNYGNLKKEAFVNDFENRDLETNKNNILGALFNIDLKEAQYIDYKFCHNDNNENILEELKDSEIQLQVFNYLVVINKIVECNDNEKLKEIFDNLKDLNIYDYSVPLESFLKAKYTELYSRSFFRIDEKNKVYGPLENINLTTDYNGKTINICVPRERFNFFVHCIGTCTNEDEITDTNYRTDWMDRPQMQDHFVACSYFNEKGLNSIRSEGSIILGFDSLEDGAILAMGDTDIDSIGFSARCYNGAHMVQESNKDRAKFFVPSQILKRINIGYNEIVVERRNSGGVNGHEIKRKPDYIIMMANSLDNDSFNKIDDVYNKFLPFVSEEDRKIINGIKSGGEIKKFLTKYKDAFIEQANELGIDVNALANKTIRRILDARYYEDCLKASSEFDIPLVVVDKSFYFKRILAESEAYDEETKIQIAELYDKSNLSNRREIFDKVATGDQRIFRDKSVDINKLL